MGAHVPRDVILNPKPKKRSTMGVHVPHDVMLNNILTRVPAKTVGRFKCVSKEWHSLLTSDMFTNMHIDNHKNNPKLLVLSKTETSFEFTTIDCEAPPSDMGLTPTRRPLPPFEGITPINICILASFHGLVCLGISTSRSSFLLSDLIFWNPLTNEYKKLSKSNGCNNFWYPGSDFGLYYNCCEDDYKLLYVNVSDHSVYIYSLKSDSWRKVDVPIHRNGTSILYAGRWNRGTYLNENLYFLQEHSNERFSSVIRFDTKSEMFSRIETPSVDDYLDTYNFKVAIMVKSYCIHVCVKYAVKNSCDTYIKLWKLDEYGKMIEVVTYQLVYDYTVRSLIPFHLMNNGSWLMRHSWSSWKHKIYKVDLKKKTQINDKGNIYDEIEYAEVRVDDDNNNNNHIIDEEVRYIETFVSPNRYMK